MEDKKSKNLLKSFQMQCGFFQMKNSDVYFHNIITKTVKLVLDPGIGVTVGGQDDMLMVASRSTIHLTFPVF